MSDSVAEERQVQYERRFAHIDRDIAGLKTDVGVLQADVRTLAAGQVALQQSQDKGFSDIKNTLQNKSEEPPKVGVGMLITLLGFLGFVIVAGIGGFWAAVLLLFSPVKEDIDEHKRDVNHTQLATDVSLLDERTNANKAAILISNENADHESKVRHDEQAAQIEKLTARLASLEAQRITDAETRGKLLAYHEWLRDDDEAIKEDLHLHTQQANHPFGVMADVQALKGDLQGELKEMRGILRELTKRVEDIDNKGSRKWNDVPSPPGAAGYSE